MAGDTVITLVGNLTADPEIRFTPSGAAVANFTIASTPRTYDRQAGEWKDGETLFMNCSVWRQVAENVADSLKRGTRVVAQGRLKQRRYETREGEKRTVVEMEVDEIGPSLRSATAEVTKNARAGSWNGSGGESRQSGSSSPYPGGSPAEGQDGHGRGRSSGEDPWGAAPAGDGWGSWPPPQAGATSDEPPF